MKNEIMQKLGVVINILNITSVCGKQNCINISGSISTLEEILIALKHADIVLPEPKE